MTGRVVSWDDARGFGFIRPDRGDKDQFVHWTSIVSEEKRKSINKDDRVSFEIEVGPKHKLQAARVVVTQKAEV
jgi:CspA family cold shock protein